MNNADHTHFSEQLPAYLLGALSPGERLDIEHHLGGCSECQAELRWLEPAAEKIAESAPQIDPPADLKARLMADVAADAELSAAIDPSKSPVATKSSRGFGLRSLLRPALLGSVAAVLVVGIFVGYAVKGSDSETGPDSGNTVTLTGKSNIGANAVLVKQGDSGTLKIANLKKVGKDTVYQAWIQRGQSVIPTDSLFTPNSNGNATTSIPDLAGVSTVMVSAEPRGGSKQPTTAPVITVNVS